MSTIIGFECADGSVIAGDRSVIHDSRVVSTNQQRVFDFEACGIAVLAGTRGVDAFRRSFEDKVRSYRHEHDGLTLDAAERIASDVADREHGEVVLAVRDDDGQARIRTVYSDGSVTADEVTAQGTGAALALGRLETADRDLGLDEGEELARDVLATVAERDAATGDEADVWTLADSTS